MKTCFCCGGNEFEQIYDKDYPGMIIDEFCLECGCSSFYDDELYSEEDIDSELTEKSLFL